MKTIFRILFAPLLWLAHGCSPLGNPVNKELSSNHYYNSSKTKIIYSPMGNWFELGKTEMQVNTENFEVLNGLLSRDGKNIFFEAFKVDNNAIDQASFFVKNGDYMTDLGFDQNHVYFFEKVLKDKNHSVKAYIIEGANPKAYDRTDWDWGHDGQYHFFRNKQINADYESFEVLNDYFAKDSNNIFVRKEKVFKPISADVTSFSILENSAHGMDKNHIFWLAFFTDDTPLIKIAYNSGEEVEYLNRYFLRLADTVYYDGVAMRSIDTDSFEIIDQLYTKDVNHVYYQNQVIENADVETFGFSNDGLGIHDKNGRYRDGKLVADN